MSSTWSAPTSIASCSRASSEPSPFMSVEAVKRQENRKGLFLMRSAVSDVRFVVKGAGISATLTFPS